MAEPSSPEGDRADERRLMALRLVVSDDLALESQDDGKVVVVNLASAARMQMSPSAFRFLKAFETPRRIDQVVPAEAAAGMLPQVRRLVEKRMLVDADAPPAEETGRLRTAVAYKFCGAPAHAKPAQPDFVILGVPYDLAGDIDSRLAAALIRQKSLDYVYQLELGDGRPRGWFDVNRGVRMLRGATLADAGDVMVEYGESGARFAERVERVLADCCTGHSVPVILGGDRSVTGTALGGLRDRGKLTVVQIGAGPELMASEAGGQAQSRMDHVERVVRFGADTPGERRPEDVVRAWGDELSIYLSIDLGLVSQAGPADARADLPAGPTLHELKMMILAVGRVHRILGIDLVGLDMRSQAPELTAIIGCHLALTAMSAAHDRL